MGRPVLLPVPLIIDAHRHRKHQEAVEPIDAWNRSGDQRGNRKR
jgi:hypothetical protein